MSTEPEAAAVPAAALLFQAPQFQEPLPVVATPPVLEEEPRPKKSKKATKKDSAEGSKKAKKASADNSENASATKLKVKKKEKALISAPEPETDQSVDESDSGKRRRRRSRTQVTVETAPPSDEITALKGSTRLEAKRMRRREGRRENRRRQSVTEAEFLARRESVDRQMVVRHKDGLDQIAVLEDGLLVEHYVARKTHHSIVGDIYLGRVQNVLPSMEAAFVDIGRGRNAVLYAGEVNWDAVGTEGQPRRIEHALKSGDAVLVQVTKDPIGHKGARLTSQITLAGRYLVLVPGSSMLGISRKLPDSERQRLKRILKEGVPENTGVIVRTAAEGATEEQLNDDIKRLADQWKSIQRKQATTKKAPQLLRGEPELVVRVVRDIFNEDFNKLLVQGQETWDTVSEYVEELSPDLHARLEKWNDTEDVFHSLRIDQQLAKGMDRKVWLPSGGTLVIDRTEALTVVDVNTGKFVGSGGTLEETVTRNNLEAAEEIVRQLRLRDIGGIIIIDFVDMVLESNRELVLRRLVECLGRDRTRHQVTEITSLGLVQMTRKRVGEGLVEAFSTTCEACDGRGFIVHEHPVEVEGASASPMRTDSRKKRPRETEENLPPVSHVGDEKVKNALSAIAAATVPGTESAGDDAKKSDALAESVAPKARTVRAEPKKSEAKSTAKKPVTGKSDLKFDEAPTVQKRPATRQRRRVVATASQVVEPVKDTEKPLEVVQAESKVLDIRIPEVTEIAKKEPTKTTTVTSKRRPRRRVTSDSVQEPSPGESAKEAVRDLFAS